MPKIKSVLNSSLAVAIVAPAVLGIATYVIEKDIDLRDQNRQLEKQLEALQLEYEGRLSQYSEWLIYTLKDLNDLVNPEFADCVTNKYLKKSIKEYSGKPSNTSNAKYLFNPECKVGFVFSSVFDEFDNTSTLNLLSEMKIVHTTLERNGKGRLSEVEVVGCEEGIVSLTTRLNLPINALLHPDAVVPDELEHNSDTALRYTEKYRGTFMCNFYGIGPEELWYTDIPWG